ncbi:hypothetical protein A2U01_0025344 [Trifolium medium]|uniref:Reverse transcriptase zinc-binding domain-containing protein n=1 Tax=Trifolium medium TaxID=97028 RepID=A0A392NWV3_9FABA|nr:hypothetical protein [Trifolium medium]
MPTRANLVTRGVLSPTVVTCVFESGAAESAHHLFLSCSIAGSLWDLVRAWIGSSLVDSTSLRGSWARRSFLQLVWLACVWVLWTERSSVVQGLNGHTSYFIGQDQAFLF